MYSGHKNHCIKFQVWNVKCLTYIFWDLLLYQYFTNQSLVYCLGGIPSLIPLNLNISQGHWHQQFKNYNNLSFNRLNIILLSFSSKSSLSFHLAASISNLCFSNSNILCFNSCYFRLAFLSYFSSSMFITESLLALFFGFLETDMIYENFCQKKTLPRTITYYFNWCFLFCSKI